MTTKQDRAVDMLLDLGNPAERRTRAELLDRALRTVLTLMEADAAAILTPWSRRGERLVLHAGSGMPAAVQLPTEGSEVIRLLAEHPQPLAVADLATDARISAGDRCPGVEAGPVLFTPLRQRNLGPGYVAAYRRSGRARFTMNDNRVMLLLTIWLGATLDNLRLSTGSEKLAVTDDIADVYNYRFLKTALNREIRRASRFGQELSLVVIEVDNLDAYTEAHGELRSTLLLRELASVLTQQVRSFDVMGRHGDEGFMLILPQTNRDGALEVGERMRAAIERYAFKPAEAGAVTVSLGVASFPKDAADMNDLLAATDRAVQQARQRGSNSVATIARKAA